MSAPDDSPTTTPSLRPETAEEAELLEAFHDLDEASRVTVMIAVLALLGRLEPTEV